MGIKQNFDEASLCRQMIGEGKLEAYRGACHIVMWVGKGNVGCLVRKERFFSPKKESLVPSKKTLGSEGNSISPGGLHISPGGLHTSPGGLHTSPGEIEFFSRPAKFFRWLIVKFRADLGEVYAETDVHLSSVVDELVRRLNDFELAVGL